MTLGKRKWVIAEGYIPPDDPAKDRAIISHEAACILNANDADANLVLTVYFSDRDPAGPYRITVPARRTLHLRFNDLDEPEKIPPGTDYSSVFESDCPVVIQHTRLDGRSAQNALLSTIAYAEDS
jgi:hypothetical protein